MKMKKILVPLGIFVAAVLLLGISSCSAADMKYLQGILQKVDGLSGNVTVTLDDGQTLTFNLADINLDDILASSDNVGLETGDHLRIQMQNHGKVKAVEFKNTNITGVIKAIGTDNATVTITTPKNGDITLKFTAETLVVVNAKGRTTAADLQTGQTVYVRYDTATMTAEKIRVNTATVGWENRGTKQGVDKENNGHQNDSANNGNEHGNKK
jgi:hypothetical protein